MDTPYRERIAALHERLRVALNPQTEQERVVVEWLGHWDIPTLEPLADMAERLARQGTAGAYERGYAEGRHTSREHSAPVPAVCAACKANECGDCEHPRGSRLTAEGQERRTCCCGRRFV